MIIIGSDHAGLDLKEKVINYLKNKKIEFLDVTQPNEDYPDIAVSICKNVLLDKNNLGIAICGTGIGICVACNKIKGIIATPAFDIYTAEKVKEHNNSNVLCLGGRLNYSENHIIQMVDTYINTKFLGERHLRRINKIKDMEERFGENLWG